MNRVFLGSPAVRLAVGDAPAASSSSGPAPTGSAAPSPAPPVPSPPPTSSSGSAAPAPSSSASSAPDVFFLFAASADSGPVLEQQQPIADVAAAAAVANVLGFLLWCAHFHLSSSSASDPHRAAADRDQHHAAASPPAPTSASPAPAPSSSVDHVATSARPPAASTSASAAPPRTTVVVPPPPPAANGCGGQFMCSSGVFAENKCFDLGKSQQFKSLADASVLLPSDLSEYFKFRLPATSPSIASTASRVGSPDDLRALVTALITHWPEHNLAASGCDLPHHRYSLTFAVADLVRFYRDRRHPCTTTAGSEPQLLLCPSARAERLESLKADLANATLCPRGNDKLVRDTESLGLPLVAAADTACRTPAALGLDSTVMCGYATAEIAAAQGCPYLNSSVSSSRAGDDAELGGGGIGAGGIVGIVAAVCLVLAVAGFGFRHYARRNRAANYAPSQSVGAPMRNIGSSGGAGLLQRLRGAAAGGFSVLPKSSAPPRSEVRSVYRPMSPTGPAPPLTAQWPSAHAALGSMTAVPPPRPPRPDEGPVASTAPIHAWTASHAAASSPPQSHSDLSLRPAAVTTTTIVPHIETATSSLANVPKSRTSGSSSGTAASRTRAFVLGGFLGSRAQPDDEEESELFGNTATSPVDYDAPAAAAAEPGYHGFFPIADLADAGPEDGPQFAAPPRGPSMDGGYRQAHAHGYVQGAYGSIQPPALTPAATHGDQQYQYRYQQQQRQQGGEYEPEWRH
ncbi:hypothetical protein H9P43_003338 [Blastocladiella emersonii ATCC 22665]|nr:hypothetical protein H9P43_003338 [Blastocladiella emersonii ATCC 22665]